MTLSARFFRFPPHPKERFFEPILFFLLLRKKRTVSSCQEKKEGKVPTVVQNFSQKISAFLRPSHPSLPPERSLRSAHRLSETPAMLPPRLFVGADDSVRPYRTMISPQTSAKPSLPAGGRTVSSAPTILSFFPNSIRRGFQRHQPDLTRSLRRGAWKPFERFPRAPFSFARRFLFGVSKRKRRSFLFLAFIRTISYNITNPTTMRYSHESLLYLFCRHVLRSA